MSLQNEWERYIQVVFDVVWTTVAVLIVAAILHVFLGNLWFFPIIVYIVASIILVSLLKFKFLGRTPASWRLRIEVNDSIVGQKILAFLASYGEIIHFSDAQLPVVISVTATENRIREIREDLYMKVTPLTRSFAECAVYELEDT